MCQVHAWTLLVLSGWMVVLLSITTVEALPLDEGCDTPGGNAGRCVLVRNCPFIRVLQQNVTTQADQNYLDQFRCGKLSDGRLLVCCPELQNEPDCGRISLKDNIVGGDETDVDEYPWMAVLGYLNTKYNNISYNCGGALIGDRFVVTAAHCVNSLGRFFVLTTVRLGEWDFSTTEDCNDVRCINDAHQDFSIAQVITHENYNAQSKKKEHDIALLKLQRTVIFNDAVSTICLPTVQMISSLNMQRESFDVAGWGALGVGKPSRSQRKMKVSLKGKRLSVCQKAYSTAKVIFTKNQLCVGGDGQKDSCRGDSGGPLMILKNNRWHLAGVVSIGSPQCGTEGIPGIYTNIGSYLDWIAGKIELESRV